MVRQTRKIKPSGKKGGSYRTPMDPIENFHIRIVNAHGSISPEYYYIVPENVYLMLPNTCGVTTSSKDVVSQSLFQTPEEGVKTFIDRFVKGGAKTAEGAPFTVYEPGDIIPIHTMTFDPRFESKYFLSKEVPGYAFGFVGTFQPGALGKLPFVHDALVEDPSVPRNNRFIVLWRDLVYRIVNGEYKYVPQNYWVIQRYCMSILNYLRGLGGAYTTFLEPCNDMTLETMTRERCDHVFRYVLPVIPQNSMAPQIMSGKGYTYSMYDIVTEIVSNRTDDKPIFVLFNTCRTLQERVVAEGSWNENAVERHKPSMSLIRAISAAGHTNSEPVNINMNKINTFRKAKGLPIHKHAVIKYDQLLALLGETKASYDASTDADFAPVIARIDPLLAILGAYTPPAVDVVGATRYMEYHIARINGEIEESLRAIAAAEAAAKATAEAAASADAEARKARDLLAFRHRRDKIKDDIAVLKRGKENASKKDTVAKLKAELSDVLEKIKELQA